ncbi:MAG: IS66 family insertion sequence element accessory protein TnpB [Bacteroidales bacterium]|nr:IS66 family insertion sequence element accessory protein TnpB [Bacteroidales bacterium]
MFALTAENTFHLYSHPTDMRKSFDALSGLVLNNLGNNPTGGEVFIFINKRRDNLLSFYSFDICQWRWKI